MNFFYFICKFTKLQLLPCGKSDIVCFNNKMAGVRCAIIDENEISEIFKRKESLNTHRNIQKSVKLFNDFINLKNIEPSSKAELNNALRVFYPCIRTVKGESYKLSSMQEWFSV